MREVKGKSCLVRIFGSLDEAETALFTLLASAFPLEQISFASQRLQSDHRHGFATTSLHDETTPWYGGVFALLLGVSVVALPDFGILVALGPLAATLTRHLHEGAPLSTPLASLGAWGVAGAQIATCDAALRDGKCLLILHGDAMQLADAVGDEAALSSAEPAATEHPEAGHPNTPIKPTFGEPNF